MEKTYESLECIRETSDSALCQTEDGTIFYSNSKGNTIYVIQEGQEIKARLPCSGFRAHGVHGRMMYFEVNKKIYKAAFTTSKGVEVIFVRDCIEGETFHRGAFCKRSLNGVNYVYRMWDDQVNDAIQIDVVDARLENSLLTDIDRGKVLYMHHSYKSSTFHRLSDTIFLLEADYQSGKLFRGSSKFFCTTNADSEIAILSTDTMELCATLRFKNFRIFDIVGIYDGRIIFDGQEEGRRSMWNKQVMSAELPKILTECEVHKSEASAKIKQQSEDNKLQKQEILNLKKLNVESNAKATELEQQNRVLTEQLDSITRKYQEQIMMVREWK